MGTIFISGVSDGLGWGLADHYLGRGDTVLGCSRRQPLDLIERGLRHCVVDFRGGEGGEKILSQLFCGVDEVDVAFLNAARLGEIRDLQDCPLEDLRETMEVNVWANQWVWKTLSNQKRRVVRQLVAISSGASKHIFRGWNGYSISKAALNVWTALVAAEHPEIQVNALAPGLIESGMQDYLTSLPPDERYPALERLRAAKGTPAMPGPREAAAVVVNALPLLFQTPSGSYQDVRSLSIDGEDTDGR